MDRFVRIFSPEESWLEYAEALNWSSWAKDAMTLAAFANRDGEFVVFGVRRVPTNKSV